MAKKKKNKKWMFVFLVIGLLLFVQPGGITNTTENIKKVTDTVKKSVSGGGGGGGAPGSGLGNPEENFLSIRLYDEDGNQIIVPDTFSMVNGIPGVASLDYTVTVTNSGGVPLSCTLGLITPPDPFDCASCSTTSGAAITHSLLSVLNGKKGSWTSNRLYTGSPGIMETLAQPITLRVETSCVYYDGQEAKTPIASNGQITFTVTSVSGTAGYTVNVDIGGVPTEYCGDAGLPGGGCQSPMETATNCPQDCATIPNIAFRTSDLVYPSGSAVAWNLGTCSATTPLTQHGYVSTTCWAQSDSTCAVISRTGYTRQTTLTGIKGRPAWATTGVEPCLFRDNAVPANIVVVFKQSGTTLGPCGGAGQWGAVTYNSADPDRLDVSSDPKAWDFAKETTC